MNKNVKRYISNTVFWGGLITAGVLMVSTNAKAYENTQIQDHYKNIIYKTPSNVEVCYDRQVSLFISRVFEVKFLSIDSKSNDLPVPEGPKISQMLPCDAETSI